MFWKRLAAVVLAALVFAPGVPALAQKRKAKGGAKATASSTAKGGPVLPAIKYTQFFLPNGLRVILHEDHSTPIVAVNVWYHVGSKNEEPGRTGFAHLFEHMMFQGSKTTTTTTFPHPGGGGAINGSTNPGPHELLGARAVELPRDSRSSWRPTAWGPARRDDAGQARQPARRGQEREAAALRQPALRAGDLQDCRRRCTPRATRTTGSPIGSMEDLSAASLDDVKASSAATTCRTTRASSSRGDFDPAEARALVEKYFGPIPQGRRRSSRPQPPVPRLDKEMREQMEDRVQLPRVYMIWHSVPAFSKDDAALDTLASSSGAASVRGSTRRSLYDKQIAQQVVGLQRLERDRRPLPDRRHREARPHASPRSQQAIDAEIGKLKAAPPDRRRDRARLQRARGRHSSTASRPSAASAARTTSSTTTRPSSTTPATSSKTSRATARSRPPTCSASRSSVSD